MGKQCGRLYFVCVCVGRGSKITADGDFNDEIKRCLLLGRKAMTNLDNILKSRDITLPTKVHLVKAMVFPVVMYGCESWTINKAELQRIYVFELWWWRRLLRVPWTARRSNQSILKEINPEYPLEELKLQYFGHVMQKTNSLEKTQMLGKIEGRRRRGMTEDEMVGWHHWLDGHVFEQTLMDRVHHEKFWAEEAQAGVKVAGRNINNLRLKLNIQKTKIMTSSPITSWQIDEETVETVADFIFLASKITVDGDYSHEIKRPLLLGREVMTNLGNGNPLQYSCLENSMDGGAWWATVHGVTKSWTWLSDSMTSWDSILKSRDITWPTKVRLVKAMVFPVVM